MAQPNQSQKVETGHKSGTQNKTGSLTSSIDKHQHDVPAFAEFPFFRVKLTYSRDRTSTDLISAKEAAASIAPSLDFEAARQHLA
jgi:hypothetical protein